MDEFFKRKDEERRKLAQAKNEERRKLAQAKNSRS